MILPGALGLMAALGSGRGGAASLDCRPRPRLRERERLLVRLWEEFILLDSGMGCSEVAGCWVDERELIGLDG